MHTSSLAYHEGELRVALDRENPRRLAPGTFDYVYSRVALPYMNISVNDIERGMVPSDRPDASAARDDLRVDSDTTRHVDRPSAGRLPQRRLSSHNGALTVTEER
jgi:hypothetical protein